MSTLSVRTWVLMSIIPLSVLLQGCDDDCEGGSGSGSGGLDPCARDGTTVAEDKECFCSKGAGTGATKMEDNICTNPKVTPAPLASGVTAPPSTAPVGAFCWNSTGECNATAEPSECVLGFPQIGLTTANYVGLSTGGDCLCDGTLCGAGSVCKVLAAGTKSCDDSWDPTKSEPLVSLAGTGPFIKGGAMGSSQANGATASAQSDIIFAAAEVVCAFKSSGDVTTNATQCTSDCAVTGIAGGTIAKVSISQIGKSPYFKIGTDLDAATGSLYISTCNPSNPNAAQQAQQDFHWTTA